MLLLSDLFLPLFSLENNSSVFGFGLVLLCQAVVGDDGVLGFLGVGVVRPPVVSVGVGEVSIIVSTAVVSTAVSTPGVVPVMVVFLCIPYNPMMSPGIEIHLHEDCLSTIAVVGVVAVAVPVGPSGHTVVEASISIAESHCQSSRLKCLCVSCLYSL